MLEAAIDEARPELLGAEAVVSGEAVVKGLEVTSIRENVKVKPLVGTNLEKLEDADSVGVTVREYDGVLLVSDMVVTTPDMVVVMHDTLVK